jgi:hypothetical protein
MPLPVESLSGQDRLRWSQNGLKFEATPCRDLFLLKVAPENPLDRLSQRQFTVA